MNKRLRRVMEEGERQRGLMGERVLMWGLLAVCLAGVVLMVVSVIRGWEMPMIR